MGKKSVSISGKERSYIINQVTHHFNEMAQRHAETLDEAEYEVYIAKETILHHINRAKDIISLDNKTNEFISFIDDNQIFSGATRLPMQYKGEQIKLCTIDTYRDDFIAETAYLTNLNYTSESETAQKYKIEIKEAFSGLYNSDLFVQKTGITGVVNIFNNYTHIELTEEIYNSIIEHNKTLKEKIEGLATQFKKTCNIINNCTSTKQFESKLEPLTCFYPESLKRKIRNANVEKEVTEEDEILKAAISTITTNKMLASSKR